MKQLSKSADFDTGAKSCGFEMKKIAVICQNGKLSNIKFKVRNVISKEILGDDGLVKDSNTHILTLNEGQFITKITVGYRFYLYKEYVTSLYFSLNTGQQVKLRCDYPWRNKEFVLDSLERPTGVLGFKTGPYITSLSFHTHYLVIEDIKLKNLADKPNGYYTLLRNYEGPTWESDKFRDIGPFGNTTGEKFEDPIVYGHWKIKQIVIRHDKGIIKNIKTTVVNSLIDYVKKSGGHGSSEVNPLFQVETIEIDPKIDIIGVRATLDNYNKLRGMQFLFNNGDATKFIGKSPQNGYIMKDMYLKPNQELIGFFGYKTDTEIESIGMKIITKKGTSLA